MIYLYYMINQDQLRQFRSLLDNAQTILVMYGSNPSTDEFAAASSLYDALKRSGKDVSVYAPEKSETHANKQLLEATKTEVGHQNLVVSFEYTEEAVDKVSYHIGEDNNKFYLTIKPKKGHEPLKSDAIEYSYTGAEADLIFLIGVNQLDNLEQLYFGYEDLYRDTPIVTLNTYPSNIGTVNFGSDSSSASEAAATVLKELQLAINPETATHLLQGIDEATHSLQSIETTADTFETVAHLLRSGGVRKPQLSRRHSEEPKAFSEPSARKRKKGETEMKVVRQNKVDQQSKTRDRNQEIQADHDKKKKQKEESFNQQPRGVSRK